MRTVKFASVCLFQALLCVVYSDLTLKKFDSYFEMTEGLMNLPQAEDEELCVKRNDVLSNLVNYVRWAYPRLVLKMKNSTEINLAPLWYDTLIEFCRNISAITGHDSFEEEFQHCETVSKNATHFYGIQNEEVARRLDLMDDFLNETTTFIGPLVEAGHNQIVARTELTGERTEECKINFKDYKDKFVRRTQGVFNSLRKVMNQLKTGLINGTLDSSKEMELSLIFPVSKFAINYNCEIVGSQGFGDPTRLSEHLKNCTNGGPLL